MERYRSIALVVLGVAIATIVDAAPAHTVLPFEDSAWRDDPPGLPEGARFAVISGHPAKAASFIMRVELPPGYKISSYRRPRDENIIVLNGAIELGVGRTPEAHTMRTLTAGAFIRLPANEWRYLATKTGATVQIFGMGPFEMAQP